MGPPFILVLELIRGELFSYGCAFFDIEWFMDRFWFTVGRNIYIIPETLFAGLSVMAEDKFLQILLVRVKVAFYEFSDKDSMKFVLGWQLWNLLK